jgi:hypothetical protein
MAFLMAGLPSSYPTTELHVGNDTLQACSSSGKGKPSGRLLVSVAEADDMNKTECWRAEVGLTPFDCIVRREGQLEEDASMVVSADYSVM